MQLIARSSSGAEERALRTETVLGLDPGINNTDDFGIGKRRHNLPKLPEIGFRADRRLLEVERVCCNGILTEETFQQINSPVGQAGQRAFGRRFADPRVLALWHALIIFRLLPPKGFRRADRRNQSTPNSPPATTNSH